MNDLLRDLEELSHVDGFALADRLTGDLDGTTRTIYVAGLSESLRAWYDAAEILERKVSELEEENDKLSNLVDSIGDQRDAMRDAIDDALIGALDIPHDGIIDDACDRIADAIEVLRPHATKPRR